jgi:hypothetical protein
MAWYSSSEIILKVVKMKIKSRIPQHFCLKFRNGVGIFPYEIVLRDIPFKDKLCAQNEDLKLQRGHIHCLFKGTVCMACIFVS